ncbi:DUF6492 family protein [Sphingomonas sp. R86521]|uniref:DUF6492 family protein n=1 Tax=Sphingomonas sp. R86521 TaxID=3093860 RepID=UPI0036D3492A
MKISAILPLKTKGRHYAENVARCDILFSSLRHFTDPSLFDRILIVVPNDELEAAQHYAKAWSDFPVKVMDESVHFAMFREFSAPHQIRPWHRQQIIKLAAAGLIDTEYFMVFDPDVFALRAFDEATLLPGGKALTHYQPRAREARYWEASGTLLGQDPHLERDAIWWTPALLSATICRSLHHRLEEQHGEPWMRVLLSRYMVDWTEYTLYWLNAEREGLLDRFHTPPAPGMPELHADESVWFAGRDGHGLDRWDAAKHMGDEGKGLFAVVQSNTRISPQAVAAKLAPFMTIDLQPFDRHHSLPLKAMELYSAVTRRILRTLHR